MTPVHHLAFSKNMLSGCSQGKKGTDKVRCWELTLLALRVAGPREGPSMPTFSTAPLFWVSSGPWEIVPTVSSSSGSAEAGAVWASCH